MYHTTDISYDANPYQKNVESKSTLANQGLHDGLKSE